MFARTLILWCVVGVGSARPAGAAGAPPAPAPPEAAPATEPAVLTLEQAKAREKAEMLAEASQLPVVSPKSSSELLSISMRDKMLHVTTALTPQQAENAQVQMPGLAGITTIQVRSHGNESSFILKNWDFATPEGVSLLTSVLQSPVQLQITQDLSTLDDQVQSVSLIQHTRELSEGEPRVKLFVQRLDRQPTIDLTAESVVELRRKHPAEVAKYLDPMFKKLRQDGLLEKVDPKLVWQLFPDAAEPDEALRSRLGAIITRLGSDNFQEREKASAELESLGQPAALALTGWDRQGLGDEQVGRLDAFMARFKIVDDAEADRLRKDPDFLLDCLYSDEVALRRRALSELRRVTGKAIAFDVDADAATRLKAISTLRETVGAPAATQPPAVTAPENPQ